MLAGLMILAAVWGLLQLTALGSFTRTVRVRAVVSGVGVGFFACAPGAALLQWTWTRIAATAFGFSTSDVVQWAGVTIDPFVEEIVKVAPLLVAGWWFHSKAQWGVTDFVLMGSAFGAGFGLFEAFVRHGHYLSKFISFPGGHVRPNSLSPPFIPELGGIVTSWIPASVSNLDLDAIGDVPEIAPHVVWSGIAGLGVGLFFKASKRSRGVALTLILIAGLQHVFSNYAVLKPSVDAGRTDILGDHFFEPFLGIFDRLDALAWLWSIAVVAAAVVFDLSVLRRTRPDLARYVQIEPQFADRLFRRVSYATLKPLWTAPIALQYARLLRSASYALHNDSPELADSLATDDAFIQSTASRGAWQSVTVRSVCAEYRQAHRPGWRHVALGLFWLVLVSPSVAYFMVGGNVGSNIQDRFISVWGLRVALSAMLVGLVWVGWQTRAWFRVLRSASDHPSNILAITALYRVIVGLSVIGAGLVTLNVRRLANPFGPADDRFIDNTHVLAALAALFLIAAIVLVIAAFIFFPPSIAVVGLAGTGLTVPVLSASGGFFGLTAVGLASAATATHLAGQAQQGGTSLLDGFNAAQSGREGASRGDPHGDGGRRLRAIEAEIEKLKAKLAELEQTQGPKKLKEKIKQKIKSLRQDAERALKGETHGRGQRGQQGRR